MKEKVGRKDEFILKDTNIKVTYLKAIKIKAIKSTAIRTTVINEKVGRKEIYIPKLSEMIKDNMEATGVTAYRLAKDCDISYTIISGVLRDKIRLSDENALKLGRYFFGVEDDGFYIRLRDRLCVEHALSNKEILMKLEKITPVRPKVLEG